MKPRLRTTLTAGACLIFCLAASVAINHRLDQIQPQAALEDTLYIDSPKMIQRAGLGFDGLMACIYWTRVVQYFGHRHYEGAASYHQLAPLLEITTHLDPHLTVAYQFGASFLAPKPPNGAGEADRAIQLMQYGIAHNPEDWKLYQALGFIYYTELNDYPKAAETFDRGSRVPGAHPYMRVLAAQMAQHAGEYETARMLWTATYETATDPQIRDNALEHLRDSKVEEDVSHLQQGVTRFGERTGRLPISMQELLSAEGIRGIPVDPDGIPYILTSQGRVLVQNPENFPLVTKGLPPGYQFKGKLHFNTN